ncbi:MAG: hypothetical protein OCC45_08170 [Desulfotalea sp.]
MKVKIKPEMIFQAIALVAPLALAHYKYIEWGNSAILSLLSYLVMETIAVKKNSKNFRSNILKKHNKLDNKLDNIEQNIITSHKIQKILYSSKYQGLPSYFKKIISHKAENYLSKIDDICDGLHITSPSHGDTYGANGLEDTRISLKCVSSMKEFWEAKDDTDYIHIQNKLFAKDVKIQRLFIYTPETKEIMSKAFEYQRNLNFSVKCINSELLSEEHSSRDYLIQDEQLLVDLTLDPNQTDHKNATETITTHGVSERVLEFDSLWAKAKHNFK